MAPLGVGPGTDAPLPPKGLYIPEYIEYAIQINKRVSSINCCVEQKYAVIDGIRKRHTTKIVKLIE